MVRLQTSLYGVGMANGGKFGRRMHARNQRGEIEVIKVHTWAKSYVSSTHFPGESQVRRASVRPLNGQLVAHIDFYYDFILATAHSA